jgi:hypothetical protein
MTTIACNCGKVKMELTGEPLAQAYCHCKDCQKVHSAAYIGVAMYPIAQTKIVAGEPLMWTLARTPRATCRDCGTRLWAEPVGLGIRGVLATLLPAGTFKPAFHIQCQDAMIPVKDTLPHFKAFPAAFGGSDDKVDW